MKLSEAIVKGCQMRPNQCRFHYVHFTKNATCVHGAAAEGTFGHFDTDSKFGDMLRAVDNLDVLYPDLTRQFFHPVQRHEKMTLGEILFSLNDDHGWSREQIALWLGWLGL